MVPADNPRGAHAARRGAAARSILAIAKLGGPDATGAGVVFGEQMNLDC
jgi:hypothetical protein